MIAKAKAKAKAELQSRNFARESLIGFTLYTKPDYVVGGMHHQIADALAAIERRDINRLMIFTPPRHGKLIADNTPVFTPNGWVMHGDLKAGDCVFSPSGKPVRVIAVSAKAAADVRVETSAGDVIYCHEAHEWTVEDRGYHAVKTVESAHFMRTTKFGKHVALKQGKNDPRYLYLLPLTSALEMPEASLPMAPYVFGAWLGDGSTTKPCITHAASDVAVIEGIEACGYEVSTVCTHPTTGVLTTYFSGPRPNVMSAFSSALKAMGVRNGKFIPTEYKTASIAQRLELLAGLIDTDGYVEPATGRVRISTGMTTLANDISDVVRSLGWRVSVSETQPCVSSSGIAGRQVVYQVGFNPDRAIPTRLERKAIRAFAVRRRVAIADVRRDPQGYVGHCIQVEAEDGLYLVGRGMVPTHNSELVSRRWPARFLGKFPDKQFIGASYGQELAGDFGRDVRNIFASEEYRRLYPDVKLASDSSAKNKWHTNRGGVYVSAGVGVGITGRGADVLSIDDPFKDRAEADSPVTRETVWNWYTSTAFTRLMPGGAVILTQTRWHEDDLAGRLLNSQNASAWHVINLPAINDAGEALFPERYPLDVLRDIESEIGPRDWSALYMQDPRPLDGGLFKAEQISVMDAAPAGNQIFRAWDLAATAQHGTSDPDYTVGVKMLRTAEGRFVILDVMRMRGGPEDVQRTIINTAGVDGKGCGIFIAEDPGQAGKAQVLDYTRRLAGWRVVSNRPTGDKATRAAPLAAQVNVGNVSIVRGSWNAAFIDELRSFPGGRHDDQVDAAADAFAQLIAAPTMQRAKVLY